MNKKVFNTLKSIISLNNNERFKEYKTTENLYEEIKSTFGEFSLELIRRYLNKIIHINYNFYKIINEYTSNIQSSITYLKELKQ